MVLSKCSSVTNTSCTFVLLQRTMITGAIFAFGKNRAIHVRSPAASRLSKNSSQNCFCPAVQCRSLGSAVVRGSIASLCSATRSRSPLLSLVHRLKSLKTNLIKFHTLKNTFHFLISISIISSYFLRNTLSSSIQPAVFQSHFSGHGSL